MCLCAGDCKETEAVKEYKHCVQQHFYSGPLIVFLDTLPSFMHEALFLVEEIWTEIWTEIWLKYGLQYDWNMTEIWTEIWTAGYGNFIVHMGMYLLPAQLLFKFRNWGWKKTIIQSLQSASVHVLKRRRKLDFEHVTQGLFGIYDCGKKLQNANHLLESFLHSSDIFLGYLWPGKT